MFDLALPSKLDANLKKYSVVIDVQGLANAAFYRISADILMPITRTQLILYRNLL
jgi:hypothetical protein